MKKLKQELEVIFNKHKDNYKSKFKKVDSILTQTENISNFDNILNKFTNEIIEKANEFLEIEQSERETYLKKLIKDFKSLSVNPFD